MLRTSRRTRPIHSGATHTRPSLDGETLIYKPPAKDEPSPRYRRTRAAPATQPSSTLVWLTQTEHAGISALISTRRTPHTSKRDTPRRQGVAGSYLVLSCIVHENKRPGSPLLSRTQTSLTYHLAELLCVTYNSMWLRNPVRVTMPGKCIVTNIFVITYFLDRGMAFPVRGKEVDERDVHEGGLALTPARQFRSWRRIASSPDAGDHRDGRFLV